MNAPAAPIVDTHTHLDEPVFDQDRDLVLERARASGVRRFVNIAYSPQRWLTSRQLRAQHSDVDIALGFHPMLAGEFDSARRSQLLALVRDLQPVAIGETGFDFSRPTPSHDDQTRALRDQLEIAATQRLPVIIHQRDAADALMDELDRWPHVAPIVLHSFDATERLTEWAVKRQVFVGIGGLATKRGSSALRALLGRIPRDRLLLETDAPYLAPPGVSDRRNEPGNLPHIAAQLAPIWSVSAEELCSITTANACALFGIPLPAPGRSAPSWHQAEQEATTTDAFRSRSPT